MAKGRWLKPTKNSVGKSTGPDYPDMPHVHAAPQTKRVQGTLEHPQGKKIQGKSNIKGWNLF